MAEVCRHCGAGIAEHAMGEAYDVNLRRCRNYEAQPMQRSYTHKAQQDVADFHSALELPIGDTPKIRRPELRASLIMEEAVETCEALTGRKINWEYTGDRYGGSKRKRLVKAIDGMCDILVVTYGTAVEVGIDIGPFWDSVHRSNMAKVGGPKRSDGKQLKPSGWEPPDIEGILLGMELGE